MPSILSPEQVEYISSFRRKPDEFISSLEKFAQENKVPILGRESAEFLEQLILIYKPERVLEIGTAIAYSTIRAARQLNENSLIDTIEKSRDNIKIAKVNIADSGLSDKINLMEGDALDLIPQFKHQYDFIFLDADKEDYIELFNLSLSLLQKGGIIFIDNLLWHGYPAQTEVPDNFKRSAQFIREVTKLFMNEESLKSTLLPIGDGIGLGVKIG